MVGTVGKSWIKSGCERSCVEEKQGSMRKGCRRVLEGEWATEESKRQKRVRDRRAGEETSWTDSHSLCEWTLSHRVLVSLFLCRSNFLSFLFVSRLDSVDCAPFLDEIDAEQIFLHSFLFFLSLVSFLSLSLYFFLVSLSFLNLKVNSFRCFLLKDKEGILAGQTVLANWPGSHNPVLFCFPPGLGSNHQEQKVWNWIHS